MTTATPVLVLVATTLELTPAETQVAVWLAEGNSVRDMADATGHHPAPLSGGRP